MSAAGTAKPKAIRCAIYTRKSTEEGLDQAFNSLHAQREACEAYVKSQAQEGWTALVTEYDDGGFSGGSMDRPALTRLLADITARRIDTIVVYKVDRLTRSLSDFAKIVDQFDANGVSFVSVTQAFNTTTSMGRLTLNVLLSFAQFEREVTGERIRDKIAQSKAKGMWMGGVSPLGYGLPTDQTTRKLVVIDQEAEVVRLLFERYLELGSVHQLARWLDANGIRSKAWISSKGEPKGGSAFARGALYHLLSNRVYLGEIRHKDSWVPRSHPAIIPQALFDQVQAVLVTQAPKRREQGRKVSKALLLGLLFDEFGQRMTATYSTKVDGSVNRYYVSARLQQGHTRTEGEHLRRVPNPILERLVFSALARLLKLSDADHSTLKGHLQRCEVHRESVHLTVPIASLPGAKMDPAHAVHRARRSLPDGYSLTDQADGTVRLSLPAEFRIRGGRSWISRSDGRPTLDRARPDLVLIKGLKSAHRLQRDHKVKPSAPPEVHREAKAPDNPYSSRLLRLAFLAPDIQQMIMTGQQPQTLFLDHLLDMELPIAWADQRALILG